jgi:hypothetical protein
MLGIRHICAVLFYIYVLNGTVNVCDRHTRAVNTYNPVATESSDTGCNF